MARFLLFALLAGCPEVEDKPGADTQAPVSDCPGGGDEICDGVD